MKHSFSSIRHLGSCLALLLLFNNFYGVAQTWQYLGAQYSVNVTSDLAVGYSGGVRTMYLAAQQDVVMKSTGSTISWTELLPPNPDFVTCLSTNPGVVYVSDAFGTTPVQKSTDGGTTWNGITSGVSNSGVTRLAISKQNQNFLYLGCKSVDNQGNPALLPVFFYSTNSGSNWDYVNGFPQNHEITRIVFDGYTSAIHYVGSKGSDGGVRRTNDGGISWAIKV
ncbi:MAG: hypothetical protein HYZ34_13235 [Ignavibacteriae bacterium]|nr:hypothetical protein [Ignavibacteriota bacterium]